MNTFGLVLIAADDYADPPGKLPASESAMRLGSLLAARGGQIVEQIVVTRADELRQALRRWVAPEKPTQSTIVYIVGHGRTNEVVHQFMLPDGDEVRTDTLSEYFVKDWNRRKNQRDQWTLVLLDCCAADIGVRTLYGALLQPVFLAPHRLALWPAVPEGAAHSGHFIDCLERVLAQFKEYDSVVPLDELLKRMRRELGFSQEGDLPVDAAIGNPRCLESPTPMSADTHAELERAISALPLDVGMHFLKKAQGGEAGDVAWYFSGRQRELSALSSWFDGNEAGMRVVTGEAGSGKSALLGHIAVLADAELVDNYRKSGLAPDLGRTLRPGVFAFDVAMQLTGRTLGDTVREAWRQLHAVARPTFAEIGRTASAETRTEEPWSTPDQLMSALAEEDRSFTFLIDALDEAQEPERIAHLLRDIAASRAARLIVGTRRSLAEGPDQPFDLNRRELLDALGASEDNTLLIERDERAIGDYVKRRLLAPRSVYAEHGAVVEQLATRIVSASQPFLFARLVTSELLARGLLGVDSVELKALLTGGHRGVFAMAVERIRSGDEASAQMLRALSLCRGRGLPENGGTWTAVARAIAGSGAIPDDAAQAMRERAAPYVMLDSEAGQATYRLSHQTFVEHFRSATVHPDNPLVHYALDHRRVAAALFEQVAAGGGWERANYYVVRYIAEHITADPERVSVSVRDLSNLATNPAWLMRALDLLGVDQVVAVLAQSQRVARIPEVDDVQRVLRRSRVALSRDVKQLPSQIHARFSREADATLANLGDALGAQASGYWLRMREGSLGWRDAFTATNTWAGKIRSLSFGSMDGETILAVGIDDTVRLWDPSRGTASERVLGNDGRRVTALSLASLKGRPVLVVVSSYDGVGVLRDAGTGEALGPLFVVPTYLDSVTLGEVGDRTLIVGAGSEKIFAWDAATSQLVSLPRDVRARAVANLGGAVVAYVADQGRRVSVLNVHSGVRVGGTEGFIDRVSLAAVGEVGGDPITASRHQAPEGDRSSDIIDVWDPVRLRYAFKLVSREKIRAMAIGEVQGRCVLAVTPDFDMTGIVSLHEIPGATDKSEEAQTRPVAPSFQFPGAHVRAAFVREEGARNDSASIAFLVDSPAAIVSGSQMRHLALTDAELVTFALTGIEGKNLSFFKRDDHGSLRLASYSQKPSCLGLVDGRAAIASTFGGGGGVGVRDIASGNLMGPGMLNVGASRRPRVRRRRPKRRIKADRQGQIECLALGQHPNYGSVLAAIYDGGLRMIQVPSGEPIDAPDTGRAIIRAIAFGYLANEHVLVTGSLTGSVIVWSLASAHRIAAFNLEHGVSSLWIVRGSDMILVAADTHYLFEVVEGGRR